MSAIYTLWGIAYVSTAVTTMTRDDLEFLLVEGRRLNRENEITGVLLHSSGNFMQYFEGPKTAAYATFERIKVSRRHHGIIELLDQAVPVRSFTGWDMGLAEVTDSQLLKMSTANWTRALDDAQGTASGSEGLGLLRMFWKSNKPT